MPTNPHNPKNEPHTCDLVPIKAVDCVAPLLSQLNAMSLLKRGTRVPYKTVDHFGPFSTHI